MTPYNIAPQLDDEANAHLVLAFRRILRPLVRILIRAGVRYGDVCEMVKSVYVESAVRDGVGAHGRCSRARTAFLTGVTKSDIRKYVDNPRLLDIPRPTFARAITEMIHMWNTDPRYLGPYNVPIELPFRQGAKTFHDLVNDVDASGDARAIADEMLAAGVMRGSFNNVFRVSGRTYVVPKPMSAPMLEHMGNAVSDLANTITYNFESKGEKKRLERSVFPDRGLPAELFPEFEELVRTLVQKLIVQADDWVADQLKALNASVTLVKRDTGFIFFQYHREKANSIPLGDDAPPENSEDEPPYQVHRTSDSA